MSSYDYAKKDEYAKKFDDYFKKEKIIFDSVHKNSEPNKKFTD